MPIEFRCVSCQKLLRVGDDAVGKKARCPDCGTIQEARGSSDVNQSALLNTEGLGPFSAVTPQSNQPENPFAEQGTSGSPFGPAASNPYLSPQADRGLPPVNWELVQAKVRAPAIAMLVVSGLMTAFSLVVILVSIFGAINGNARLEAVVLRLIPLIIPLAVSSTIAVGAMKMRRMESYGLAITAAVLSMLPCHQCCILSMPFGIWALIVLLETPVKQAFQLREAGSL